MIERFEIEMLGGGWERKYRRARPETERLPWGTLQLDRHSAETLASGREHWTVAAFQEHATAAMCGEMVRLLVLARAPLDLIATATRFPLDELVHVELCARLATELGGAVDLQHDPQLVAPSADPDRPVLLATAELAVRVFCVGEAVSVPIIAATWRETTQPLPRAILEIILRDEASHGSFGWAVLDWASDKLEPAWRQHLARVAVETIADLEATWDVLRRSTGSGSSAGCELGWLEPRRYLQVAQRALDEHVRAPLRARRLCE